MKYQNKDEDKKPLVVRLPVGLKNRLDIASNQQGISQSRLAVDLISEGLNQSVSVADVMDEVADKLVGTYMIRDEEKTLIPDTADAATVIKWLNRI
tara:strand:- start:101 stop:388 length:288 start_codon:yes stop_codon:yes gene_type:complete